MKRFTEEHEWVEIVDGVAVIGISSHAASELGDITFIEIPEVNAAIAQGDVLTVVESVKAASDVFCPVSGTIVAVNSALEEHPEIMNESSEDKGWICKMNNVREDDIAGLMTEGEYADFITA